MFIEQRLSALSDRVDHLEAHQQQIKQDLLLQEQRISEAITRISQSSGVSPEVLAQLLEAVARNLYGQGTPPATKGTAQDDGVPKDKPSIQPAQNGDALAGSPGEPAADEAADGGAGSEEVVAPAVEAEASPPVDEPAQDNSPEAVPPDLHPVDEAVSRMRENQILREVKVVGRVVHGPRCDIMLTPQQAKIVDVLTRGPAGIDDLSGATNEKQNRMTALRIANMAIVLRDAGLKIVVESGKYHLKLAKVR